MDALGVVFGIALGTFLCFLMAVAYPHPAKASEGTSRSPRLAPAGVSPVTEGRRMGPESGPRLQAPTEQVVVLRVQYSPSGRQIDRLDVACATRGQGQGAGSPWGASRFSVVPPAGRERSSGRAWTG